MNFQYLEYRNRRNRKQGIAKERVNPVRGFNLFMNLCEKAK